MRLFSAILTAAGLALEAMAAYALIVHAGSASGLALAAGVHVLASAVLMLGVYGLLPAAYRLPCSGALAFLGSSALFIPVVGPLGLITFMLAGLYYDYQEQPQAWDTLAMPDLPFQPVAIDPDDVFLRDGLASVLAHFDDRNRRQRAIMACRHLPQRQAVPILRKGLADAADEVRLLAYAMLNSIERDLEAQLGQVERLIQSQGDADGELHEERASLYWEYSYLTLVAGSVEAVLLGKALEALDVAIGARETAQRWLLRARICLVLSDYDAAEAALNRAEAGGLDADDAAPRWAELAYRRRDFSAVAPALRRMTPKASLNPTLRPVLEFWL